ncbi:BRCT domain containing protein [Parasponia andersonii]|uniref:BRCT domain containing protein n=1 Tax=Parasponia andersonii TaxID=3476 RepID=A0A2P5C877_PARAD|nr:BRCT domain containing protein [Parasponia andersonii]
MAIHLNTTEIHRPFDFHSQNLSSVSSENKMQNTDEVEDHLLFQNTLPLENSLGETQSGNLDFDSDIGENRTADPTSERGEEMVVLDSEDDEINGSRIVGATRLLPERKTKGSEQHCVEGTGVSLTDFGKETALECDCELVRLKDNSTQEIAEWSETDDALGFVDRFVSINNVEWSQGADYRRTTRVKSLTVSSTNGPQILARRISLRAQVKEKGKFEWVDSDHPCKGMDSSEFGGTGMDVDDKGCGSLGNECIREKGLSSFCKKTKDSTHLESRFVANGSKDGREMTHVSEVNIEVNSSNELELTEKPTEASDVGGDTLDTYDIGFNTQIAAEAIEALAHGHCFGHSSADACQCIEKTVNSSLSDVTEENAQLKHPSIQKSGDNIGHILANMMRKKRSDRKFGRKSSSSCGEQPSIQEIDSDLTRARLVKRQRFLNETRLCCSNYVDSNENSGKTSPKPIKLSKAEGFLEMNTTKITGNDVISSTTTKNISLFNEQSEGQCVKFSPVAGRTGLLGSGARLKRIDDRSIKPVEKMDDNIEHGIVVYRRKRSRVNANPLKVSSAREKCSKWCYISEESRMSKVTSSTEVDTWSYPRRKRTSRNVQKHPNRTYGPNVPFTSNYQVSIAGNANVKGKTESSSVGEEKIRTSIASSIKTSEQFGSECTTISSKIGKNVASSNHMSYDYHKRPCDKNVPKSSLLKELINLGVPEHIPELAWKELRRRKDMAHVRILFSQHLEDDVAKQQKKIAARLGISIASCSMDATHFIADEFARTRNMLEAIALGKPVVTHLWLESCGQASCFIDERNYILRDAKKEKKFGFNMPVSLARASQHPLLKGYKVFITPNIKPDKEMITNLVKAVHGQPVEENQISALKGQDFPEYLLIISCKEDHSICVPFLKKGATVYSSELLLNGIVTQKLQYKRHQLFTNDVRRSCS